MLAQPVNSSSRSRLSWGRYEAKYLISEAQATEVRRFCVSHLPPDPHGSAHDHPQYPILSVYLDSVARHMLRDSVERTRDRVKLRVRTYQWCHEPLDGHTVFLEIKRKTNGLIRKNRAQIPAHEARSVLEVTDADHALSFLDSETGDNLVRFLNLRRRFRAQPVVGVFYLREAYQGWSIDRIRITLDRHMHYGLLAAPGVRGCDHWRPVHIGGVILEIKFTNSYPFWVRNMLHRIEGIRRGVCKYVICARAAGAWCALPERLGSE